MHKANTKPLIAISRCLLGDNVRYDAKIKSYPLIINFIAQHFEAISVCPEVELGLGVPRPAVQLSGSLTDIKITGRDDPSIDISHSMHTFCKQRSAELNSIHGYIFKSKSPSCGIADIPIFNRHNKIITTTHGVFVNAILQKYPQLPITDEQHLLTTEQCHIFLRKVKQFQKNYA